MHRELQMLGAGTGASELGGGVRVRGAATAAFVQLGQVQWLKLVEATVVTN